MTATSNIVSDSDNQQDATNRSFGKQCETYDEQVRQQGDTHDQRGSAHAAHNSQWLAATAIDSTLISRHLVLSLSLSLCVPRSVQLSALFDVDVDRHVNLHRGSSTSSSFVAIIESSNREGEFEIETQEESIEETGNFNESQQQHATLAPIPESPPVKFSRYTKYATPQRSSSVLEPIDADSVHSSSVKFSVSHGATYEVQPYEPSLKPTAVAKFDIGIFRVGAAGNKLVKVIRVKSTTNSKAIVGTIAGQFGSQCTFDVQDAIIVFKQAVCWCIDAEKEFADVELAKVMAEAERDMYKMPVSSPVSKKKRDEFKQNDAELTKIRATPSKVNSGLVKTPRRSPADNRAGTGTKSANKKPTTSKKAAVTPLSSNRNMMVGIRSFSPVRFEDFAPIEMSPIKPTATPLNRTHDQNTRPSNNHSARKIGATVTSTPKPPVQLKQSPIKVVKARYGAPASVSSNGAAKKPKAATAAASSSSVGTARASKPTTVASSPLPKQRVVAPVRNAKATKPAATSSHASAASIKPLDVAAKPKSKPTQLMGRNVVGTQKVQAAKKNCALLELAMVATVELQTQSASTSTVLGKSKKSGIPVRGGMTFR